jgi:hypothetical protein
MAETRMIELAEELLRVAKAGKASWKGRGPGLFEVTFPNMSLVIFRSGAADYLLKLVNDRGEDVESLYVDTGNRDKPAYPLLREIFELACGQAIDIEGDIDKALDYLKRS